MKNNNGPYDTEKELRFDPAVGRLSRLQFFVGSCALLVVFSVVVVLGLLGPMLGAFLVITVGPLFIVALWMMLTMRFRDVVMKCPFCWASACVVIFIISFIANAVASPMVLVLILIGVGSLPSKP